MLRVYNEIHKAAVDETANRSASPLEFLKAAKELLPQPPPPSEDKMLTSVVTLLTTQLQIQSQAAERAATERATEAKELREEIRSMRNGPNNDGVSKIK